MPDDDPARAVDILIVGGGMAGSALAANLAAAGMSVLIVEAESQVGYHSTGRSAAVFSQTYGGPIVRSLSTASRGFFFDPPAGFADQPLVRPRGQLHVADATSEASLEAFADQADIAAVTRRLSSRETADLVPVLRPDHAVLGLLEPDARDIDVHGLQQGFLKKFRAAGGRMRLDTRVTGLQRRSGGWNVQTSNGDLRAGIVVNAAGGWAGEVARLAGAGDLHLQPCRRTAILVPAPAGFDPTSWPFVMDAAHSFYFKPDAGALLVSPADETPVAPCDAQADELDVAITVDRLERATSIHVRRVTHRWAGLRTFARDREPVVGFDPAVEGFFWLAALGGYGIQTAPAVAELAAGLVVAGEIGSRFSDVGLSAESLSPARFAVDGEQDLAAGGRDLGPGKSAGRSRGLGDGANARQCS
jgi:D-arginine dehydrogenase